VELTVSKSQEKKGKNQAKFPLVFKKVCLPTSRKS